MWTPTGQFQNFHFLPNYHPPLIKVGDGILEEEEEEEEEAGARCIFGDDAGNVARILPSSRVASYKRKEMLAQLVSRVLMPPVLSVISQY